ncbi:unnamed protein product [Moneuplotes crassus]|uniref:Hexose transporter 1 n=1 Tax=Euplotes crassus TaxID=5936 RepID=A0AAD1UED3_EUPCR|nr:unnamed protein product [Moneuplotes crassus]
MENFPYMILWGAFLTIGHFHFGFLVNSLNVLWSFTPCIYGFPEEDTRLIDAIAFVIFPATAVIGGAISWKLSRYGKRKALIVSSLISLIGSGLTFIQSHYFMIVGRAVLGIGFGVTNAVSPLFLYEISRKKNEKSNLPKLEHLIVSIQFWIILGYAIPSILELYIRDQITDATHMSVSGQFQDYEFSRNSFCEAIEGTHIIWREMYAVAAIVTVIKLLALLLIFRKENPNYVQHCEQKSLSLSSKEAEPKFMSSGINNSVESQQSTQCEESLLEQDTWSRLCTVRERRKLLACFVMRGFNQLTGLDIVINYGNHFIFSLSAPSLSLGFFLVTIGIFFPLIAMFFLLKFGRKTLFMIAMILMCFNCCILFQLAEKLTIWQAQVPIFESFPNFGSSIFIVMYMLTSYMTLLSTPMLYSCETLSDKGMAVITMIHWSIITVISLIPSIAMIVVERLGNRVQFRMGNAIYFFIFSGTAILGFFFTYMFVKETKDKTKEEIDQEFDTPLFELDSEKLYRSVRDIERRKSSLEWKLSLCREAKNTGING